MATISDQSPWKDVGDRHNIPIEIPVPRKDQSSDFIPKYLTGVEKTLRDPQAPPAEFDDALEDLFRMLLHQKQVSTESEWRETIQICRAHPIRRLIHEDPFTFRAYSKPRRYAGDAVMMDYIYGREESWDPPHASAIGSKIFRFTTNAPASEGVRARRGYVADALDDVARERKLPDALVLASGHLREASMSSAIRRRKFGRFIALDADPLSLQEVHRCYGIYGVSTFPSSVRRLLGKRLDLGRFDLIYSTGLFDYVKPTTGRRLVSVMFRMLKPGGRLLVANFLPNVRDIGYMEAFMDWQLIYRERHEMVDLTMEIPQGEIEDIRLVPIENRNILFLEVTRA